MIHEMILSAIISGAIGFSVGYFKLDEKFSKWIKNEIQK